MSTADAHSTNTHRALLVHTLESELRVRKGGQSILLLERGRKREREGKRQPANLSKADASREEREGVVDVLFNSLQVPNCFIVNEAMMVGTRQEEKD